MRILIVASGNSKYGINPVVKNQMRQLSDSPLELHTYSIEGKGARSYLRAIIRLNKKFCVGDYDLIHAHYSLSGIVASLGTKRTPIVVSLMGSDVYSGKFHRLVIKLMVRNCWTRTIVKTEQMAKSLQLQDLEVVPNGVDLEFFKPLDRDFACTKVGFDPDCINITFFSNPNRLEKNFPLAQQAVDKLNDKRLKLHVITEKRPEEIPIYLNATDIVLLTSNHEGSPNIIKEAMACNKVIVSTNVGDVRWLLENVRGGFISEECEFDIQQKLLNAISFVINRELANGREKLINLGLDAANTTNKLINIYNSAIHEYSN